jgi:hypothetical protein
MFKTFELKKMLPAKNLVGVLTPVFRCKLQNYFIKIFNLEDFSPAFRRDRKNDTPIY